MFKCFLSCAGVLLGVFAASLSAQTISISYQTPDQLVVCSTDTLRITVQNNTAVPIAGALLDIELPAGLHYIPGSAIGAADSIISDLEKPVLALPILPPGVPVVVRLQLSATCDLVEAINSAQLFSALLRVRAGALQEQVTTTKFQIQTSLLVITQVDNSVLSGEKGDVLTRTLHVRNTRLGPVRHLFVRDAHEGGIRIHIPGAVTEQNSPILYTAYFDGTFFSQFGNGDALFDFGETVLIKEEVELTDCGIPPKTTRSSIATEWSCAATDPPCQGDSIVADVHIKTSTKLPILNVQATYPIPWERCGQSPTLGTLKVINYGPAPGEDVFVNIAVAQPYGPTAIDPNSIRIVANGVATPVPANLFDTLPMPLCGVTYASAVSFVVPLVPAFDTVEVHYDFYYCTEMCSPVTAPITVNHFYRVPCPEGGSESSLNQVVMRPTDLLLANVYYQIGECLDDGQTYDFRYVLNSDRLVGDSGYLWIELNLPWGLFWSDDCPPVLGGKSPVSFSIDTLLPFQRVRMGFELPLSSSALQLPFCLRNTCASDAAYVYVGAENGQPPNDDGIFYVYDLPPGDSCGVCGYEVRTRAMLSLDFNADLDCAFSVCDSFKLATSCQWPGCEGGGGGGSGDDTGLRQYFYAERANLGLPDNNNDREADPSGAIDPTKIRRDRFISGDTLSATFATKVVQGANIGALIYQMFVETARSDFGHANVLDTFELGPQKTNTARQYLADTTHLRLLQASLTVWDSAANTSYTCDNFFNDWYTGDLFGYVLPVNIKPFAVEDQLTSMSRLFVPNFGALAATGCLPAGFVMKTGDSIAVHTSWKLDFNFVPFSKQHQPPLINVELGMNARLGYGPTYWNYRQFDTLMIQYSGVWDSLTAGIYGIRPCEPSQQVTPFAYNVRLARENLFPYEVRPLSVISDYAMIMPPGLVPTSAHLAFLRLQENIPLPAYQNIPLPFSTVPDSVLYVDFSPAYTKVLDEGYALRANLVFGPSCAFTLPDSSAQHVTLDFEGCIGMPDPRVDTLERKLGFFSNHPRDTITTAEPLYFFTSGAVSVDVLLRNLAPAMAPNYWIQLVNPEGGLVNPTITMLSTGAVISPANGVFHLGNLLPLGLQNLRISATNTSCEQQSLLVVYGWNCQPLTQPDSDACGRDSLLILLRPRQPEIELELIGLPVNVPLCDTSDFFVLELSNADLGLAYDPFVHIELPPGLTLLPGSCEIAYPANAAFLLAPDPTDTGNGLLEWNLTALLDSIAVNGLLGVNATPKNALRIRFRAAAECGAVSSAQLIFGARAEWYCGKPTNSLRKASDPIIVEGATPTYAVQLNVTEIPGGPVPCHSERTLSVGLILSGPALPGDSVYLELPPGYAYVPGSYLPGTNALPGGPQASGNVLRWALPVALPANSAVQFSFKVLSGDAPNCDGAVIRVQARQRTAAFCPTINDFCTIYVSTGERLLPLAPYVPDVAITSATGSIGMSGTGVFEVEVTNNGGAPAALSVVQIVRDVDGDGVLSAADTVFFAGSPGKTLASGETFVVPLQSLNPLDLCNLLVVIPAGENCACATVVFPVTAQDVTYPPKILCLGDSVLLGLTNGNMPGHTYTWSGTGAPACTDCPQFHLLPGTSGAYTLVLTDAGPGCTVEHAFSVQVLEPPVLLAQNAAICRGQQVLLETSAAATWQWSGPGIGNPGAAFQKVQPAQSATYYVTATGTGGCVLTDSVSIAVFLPDSIDLGTVRTCEGTPVDVFGTMTDVPGLYHSPLLTNANGCDSIEFLVLEVTPNTEAQIVRCAPDTVLVFNKPVTLAGTYCDTIPSSLGCDSIHCVTISDFPIPSLPEEADTIFFLAGTSVVLPGPGGYAGYLWMPPDWLDCPTCPSPTATPPDTMAYTLVVRTGDNCPDTITYRLFPFPPCDPARISMPNAFTPDNDGTNDSFAPVFHEGVEVISRLTIFNRWGQKVYESTAPNAAWDGTTGGEPAPSDVYVWLLEVLCAEGERKLRWGDVAVMR